MALASIWTLFITTVSISGVTISPDSSVCPADEPTERIAFELTNGNSYIRTSDNYCLRESQTECAAFVFHKKCFGKAIPGAKTTSDLTGFLSQQQTLEKMKSFEGLKYFPGCWRVIQPFLCAVLYPECRNVNGVDLVILPSFEMCEVALKPCRLLFRNTSSAHYLKCENYPRECKNDFSEIEFESTGICPHLLEPVKDPKDFHKDVDGCGWNKFEITIGILAKISNLWLPVILITSFNRINWRKCNKNPLSHVIYGSLWYAASCIAVRNLFCFIGIVSLRLKILNDAEISSCLNTFSEFSVSYYFIMLAVFWCMNTLHLWDRTFQPFTRRKLVYKQKLAYFMPIILTIMIFLTPTETECMSRSAQVYLLAAPVISCEIYCVYINCRSIKQLKSKVVSLRNQKYHEAFVLVRTAIPDGMLPIALISLSLTSLLLICESRNSLNIDDEVLETISCIITSVLSDGDMECEHFNGKKPILALGFSLFTMLAAEVISILPRE